MKTWPTSVLIIGIAIFGSAAAQSASNKDLVEKFDNTVGQTMVLIKPGKFTMGSPLDELGRDKEEAPHEVQITIPFYMSTTEVTQKQWIDVMGTRPFGEKSNSFKRIGDNYPAIYIDWEEAQEFCKKLSEKEGMKYTLPTEAQWEFACRAGRSTPFNHTINRRYPYKDVWCYERIRALNEKGNNRQAREVGQLKPNKWGLYDMHGNVWEWCSDFYDDEYYENSETFDPSGPEFGDDRRVLRGGAYKDKLELCRSAQRGSGRKSQGSSHIGFRVVAVPGSEKGE